MRKAKKRRINPQLSLHIGGFNSLEIDLSTFAATSFATLVDVWIN